MLDSLKIGLFGGTFDPIHIGHLIIAELARQKYNLDRVVFIPAGNPPHKSVKLIAPAKDRFEMVRLAIEDNPFFEINSIEVFKESVSYSVDTLKALKNAYPEKTKFFFIVGEDSLLELKTWRKPDEILRLCNLIVYRRPDYLSEPVQRGNETLNVFWRTGISFIDGPLLNVSSTWIRKMNMDKMSIKYLVPVKIEEYIKKYSLYSGSQLNG